MGWFVMSIHFVAFEMEQQVINEQLFISKYESEPDQTHGSGEHLSLLCISENDRHGIGNATQEIGSHNKG